jgi:hypothetical protein
LRGKRIKAKAKRRKMAGVILSLSKDGAEAGTLWFDKLTMTPLSH